MTLEDKTRDTLQWERIEQAITARCTSAQSIGEGLLPANTFAEARELSQRSREAADLTRSGAPLPMDGLTDITAHLDHLERGGVSDEPALHAVGSVFRVAERVRKHLTRKASQCPHLHGHLSLDPELDRVAETLLTAVDDTLRLRDEVDPELEHLRASIKQLRERIVRKLEHLIQERAPILSDSFFTERDGRYVLPVRVDAHERFAGIVHGTSQSGATLFVEPQSIVTRGNELTLVREREKQVQRRVLAALSGRVVPHVASGRHALAQLQELDVRNAAGNLALHFGWVFPKLEQSSGLHVGAMRHPFFDLDGNTAVPNDVPVPRGQVLVISGPNAGGKTVVLKTLGLMALMVRAGLAIPATPDARVGFFRPVAAELGDGQSLEKNLSTFSSHIRALSHMLSHLSQQALVLLDEPAGGTAPQEGAALACALAETLVAAGSTAILTTHYQDLKSLALRSEHMENASVNLHADTLSPTFHISVGSPGSSHALVIAKRFGLPEAVIDRAKGHLGKDTTSLEDAIETLNRTTEARRLALQQVQTQQQALHQQEHELQVRHAKLKEEFSRQLGPARQGLIERIRQVQTEMERAQKVLRRSLQDTRNDPEQLAGAVRDLQQTLAEARGALPVPDDGPTDHDGEHTPAHSPSSPPEVGDRVYVNRLRGEATVTAVEGKQVQVMVGSLKLMVALAETRPPKSRTAKPRTKPVPRPPRPGPAPNARTSDNTVDVRGMRLHDATAYLESALDRHYTRETAEVYVLHGRGSEQLMRGIHAWLRAENPYVSHFRSASADEGGGGITVVTLRD